MKLVFIIGDAAVGKMTVGQELMKTTGLRLFHNHMSIEPIIEIFGRYDGKTIAEMRDLIFKNCVALCRFINFVGLYQSRQVFFIDSSFLSGHEDFHEYFKMRSPFLHIKPL